MLKSIKSTVAFCAMLGVLSVPLMHVSANSKPSTLENSETYHQEKYKERIDCKRYDEGEPKEKEIHYQILGKVKANEEVYFNARDAETGIWITAEEGVFPKDVKLVVKELSTDSSDYEDVVAALDTTKKEIAERMKIFDISVKDGQGNDVNPDNAFGKATVRIPVPEDFDKDDLEVYRILYGSEDAEFTEEIVKIDGVRYCEFKTDHFCPYVLVDKDMKYINSSYVLLGIIGLIISFAGGYLTSMFVAQRKKEN